MPKKTGKAKSKRKPAKIAKSTPKPVVKSEIAYPKLPNVWQITKTAYLTLWNQRELFLGVILIFGLLNLVLVKGLASSGDITALKDSLNSTFTGHTNEFISSLGVFVALVGGAGNGSSDTAGAYQLFLALIGSLALIWTLREVLAGQTVRVRDAYYRSTAPLIPFTLVLLIIGLQLLPLLFGIVLYDAVSSAGIADQLFAKVAWILASLSLASLTLYWLTSSIFGLYIVTLADMTPVKALRSARQLVRGRRLAVFRKLIALPLLLLVAACLIMLPIILWLTPAAQWVFFVLTMFGLAAVHSYLYTLYRELLNE